MGSKNKEARKVSKAQLAKDGASEVAELQRAEKTERKPKVSAPPAPPLSLGGVENPLIGTKGLKRAMVVAICSLAKDEKGVYDETKAAVAVRQSGILYRAGYTKESITDTLVTSEWSGRPYARFATKKTEGKAYAKNHPEKVEKCLPFARELMKAISGK